MASNLKLYVRCKELVNTLELHDEQGKQISQKDLIRAIDYINLVFGLVERRGK